MEVILCIFSEPYKNIAKKYFDQNGIHYSSAQNFDDLMHNTNDIHNNLIAIECDGTDQEFHKNLARLRSIYQHSEIICLFHPAAVRHAPEFVNRKLINGFGILPVDECEFSQIISNFLEPRIVIHQIIENITDKEYVIKDILSMEYIYDLIYGNITRVNMLNEISKLMGLERVPQIVLTIQCDDFWNKCEFMDNRERYSVKRKILNNIRYVIDNKCRGVASTLIGTDKIVVLIDCHPIEGIEAEDFAYQIANDIKMIVKEKTPYTVSIGISNYCMDYKKLWNAFEESFRALSYSFVRGDDSVIRHNDNKAADIFNYQTYFDQFEQNLIKSISKPVDDRRTFSLEEICEIMTLSNYRPEIIKSIIIKILLGVVQYCYNLGMDFNLLSKIMIDFMVEILKTNSLKNIENICECVLESMSLEIQKLRKQDKWVVMQGAETYINKYYSADLSLEEVADVFNVSQYHFSRIFKSYFGVNYIQYLTNIRIEKSKELLVESDMTIEAISSKIGYSEVAYFSRVFKNAVGVSPRQYRNQNREQKSTNS